MSNASYALSICWFNSNKFHLKSEDESNIIYIHAHLIIRFMEEIYMYTFTKMVDKNYNK